MNAAERARVSAALARCALTRSRRKFLPDFLNLLSDKIHHKSCLWRDTVAMDRPGCIERQGWETLSHSRASRGDKQDRQGRADPRQLGPELSGTR